MGGSGSLGNESGFPQAFSDAKLLITIIDGPCKFSVTSDTIGPNGQTKGYSLWGFGKKVGVVVKRPLLLLRESVIGLRLVNPNLGTMNTFPKLLIF